jgi:hypothetical protein
MRAVRMEHETELDAASIAGGGGEGAEEKGGEGGAEQMFARTLGVFVERAVTRHEGLVEGSGEMERELRGKWRWD